MTFWSDKQCAISLTYDDAIPVHYEEVAPLLSEYKIHATFYAHICSSLMYRTEDWRRVALQGHELGNHTVFHPCRNWPDFDLCDYSEQRWKEEVRVANFVLHQIDGRTERTFGNTCCNNTIGRNEEERSLEPLIEEFFVAARGSWNNQIIEPTKANFKALGHFSGDNKTFDQLREEVEITITKNGWSIYMFHGVGKDTNDLFIDEDEHHEFIEWLSGQTEIWTAPVVEVAKYVRKHKNVAETS